MDEDVLNMSVRRFLKTVGVTSQREIEKAVRDAVGAGRLAGLHRIPAKARVTLEELDVEINIDCAGSGECRACEECTVDSGARCNGFMKTEFGRLCQAL